MKAQEIIQKEIVSDSIYNSGTWNKEITLKNKNFTKKKTQALFLNV
jgi:hypothetical protein